MSLRLFSVFFLFLALARNSGPVVASEREIVLDKEYQTRKEKGGPTQGRVKGEISFGYGASYFQFATGLYAISPKYATYLSALGQQFAEVLASLRLSTTAAGDPRFGLYLAIPFAAMQQREGGRPNHTYL